MKCFWTGSRVYGLPLASSDFDLVVYGNERDFLWLCDLRDHAEDRLFWQEHENLYPSSSIRIGELNVIFCRSRWQYFKWWLAMKICKLCGPLSRQDCVRVHKKII